VVAVGSLNLRAGPDIMHPVIDVLATGTAVAVHGRSHDFTWLAVLSPDLQDGWLSAGHVVLRRDPDTVPTRATPTPPPTRTPTPAPADPGLALVLAPPIVAQGDPVLVRLRAPGARQVVAALGQATVPMFAAGDEAHAGLLPVPAEMSPGEHAVHVTAVDADGTPRDETAVLVVLEAPFGQEGIALDAMVRETLEPGLREAESAMLVARVWSVVTAERMWSGVWQRPITISVSSRFGTLRDYNGGAVRERHTGTDLRGRTGTPVAAPAAGRVLLAEPLAVRGHSVWLDHGWGVQSGYFHLHELRVAQGDTVAAGQVLGTVGRTGRATGPHLHWEVRVAGVPVQPLEFLQRDVGAVP